MRVSLVNPPFKTEHGRFSRGQRSPAITKSGTLYYPMFLCYAAGLLEKHGFEVQVVDAPAQQLPLGAVRDLVRSFAPRLIVVDTSTPSIVNDVEVAEILKADCAAQVILVGTHASALPREALGMGRSVDAVARGEYEHTVRDLALLLRDHPGVPDVRALGGVAGITFRSGEEILDTPPRAPIEDLDSLPFVSEVYRRHLRIRDYFYTITQYPQVALLSARGCPYRCIFCVYPQAMHGHRVRKRSVENLVEEFGSIVRNLPEVREIFIEDDTFTVDKKRVLAFSEAYLRAGLSIPWTANSRADVDAETLVALRACNCRLLCVGFESGDQGMLDRLGKRLTLEESRQFVANAQRAGVLVHACFVAGGPGETQETLERTLAFAKKLEPDTAQFFPLMVYPGTTAFDWASTAGYLATQDYRRWLTDDGQHNCVVSRPGLTSDDLVKFCDRARREFYLRPAYLRYRLRRLARRPREDAPRLWKSMRIFARHLLRRP